VDGAIAGLIAVADEPRPEAADAVARLRALHLQVGVVTGDQQAAAEAMAREVGIEDVTAGALPKDKVRIVNERRAAGMRVAMVGDGINDAPALAAADVGIAMGAGADIAIEAADITVVGSNLNAVPDTIVLSRATIRIIRQNLFWAFAYNVIGIPIAAGALYPFNGWLLSPMIASLAMALSSVSVVANSLRLRRVGFS
jgi:Cu+-exporting ATPase